MILRLWSEFVPRLAHEVYVLTPSEIKADRHDHVDVFNALSSSHNLVIFLGFAIGTALVLALALWLKSQRPFQRIGAFIDRSTFVAQDLIRIVFGASLILGGLHQAVFGPELPFSSFTASGLLAPVFIVIGAILVSGLFTRVFAAIAALIWLFAFAQKGWYMLTYANYLGEAVALMLLSTQTIGLDAVIRRIRGLKQKAGAGEKYAMPVARWLFGFSLLYTGINIKFDTSALSLDVVNRYHLTNYFHFDPLFVVFGAGLVELLIAVLYMAGLLQRLNTIVFMAFITASLLFFKETVWPHYLLFGLAAGIFLHRPDAFALDGRWFKMKSIKSKTS